MPSHIPLGRGKYHACRVLAARGALRACVCTGHRLPPVRRHRDIQDPANLVEVCTLCDLPRA